MRTLQHFHMRARSPTASFVTEFAGLVGQDKVVRVRTTTNRVLKSVSTSKGVLVFVSVRGEPRPIM